MTDPIALIADYRAAYTKANDKPAPQLKYERGFYVFPDGVKYRSGSLIAMLTTLRERIALAKFAKEAMQPLPRPGNHDAETK